MKKLSEQQVKEMTFFDLVDNAIDSIKNIQGEHPNLAIHLYDRLLISVLHRFK